MREGAGGGDKCKVRTSMDASLCACVELMLPVFSLTATSVVWLPATSIA